MALMYIKDVGDGVRIGLWRMDEEPDELLGLYPHLRCLMEGGQTRQACSYKSIGRQKEFLCVRALLMEMTGDDRLCIDHEESGRPVVEGWHVSISHTRGYAVLMLCRKADSGRHGCLPLPQAVGVDIEYRSDRIVKIASHFIRPDEMAWDGESPTEDAVEQMLILWCAKETLYKLHSEDNLHYFDMRQVSAAKPAMGAEDQKMTLENMKRGEQVTIHVTLTPEYVLTWALTLNS